MITQHRSERSYLPGSVQRNKDNVSHLGVQAAKNDAAEATPGSNRKVRAQNNALYGRGSRGWSDTFEICM